MHGDGKQSRDLTYVSDAVEAFLKVGASNKTSQKVINFGTGKHHNIIFLAKKLNYYQKANQKIVFIEQRKAEVQRLTCDASLCKKLTGWKPKVNIAEGLRRNIEWAKKNWTV